MSLLVGLPLKLFHILFVLLRFLWLPLLMLLVVWLVRRGRRGQETTSGQGAPREPKFNGPVYTVEYEEVDEDEDGT